MENYFHVMPFFIVAVSAGIIASFLFGKNSEISRKRILKEVFGGLWISIIAYILLDEMTTLGDPILFVTTSAIAFLNSQIIEFLGNDLVLYLSKGLFRLIKNLADRVKGNSNSYDEGYDDNWAEEDQDNPKNGNNNEPKLE